MCTMSSFTFDGHQYQLVQNTAERTMDIICANSMELIATITTSPCEEYYICEAANDSNPLGMATVHPALSCTYHHAGCTTIEDVALSAIAGSY